MKLNKIFKSVIASTGVLSVVTPVICLSSCNKGSTSIIGNLMDEFNPTIAQLPATDFGNCFTATDVINIYLDEIQRDRNNFRQDLFYTLTRGVKNYEQYLRDNGVTINSSNYNAKISEIKVDREGENNLVSFDLEMIIEYDYSSTSAEILTNLGVKYSKWNTATKFHFVLDFNTASFAKNLAFAKRRQLTLYNQIANVGISELSSTIQILYSHGSAMKVEGSKSVDININDPQQAAVFIDPQYDYWSAQGGSGTAIYNKRIEQINLLKEDGHYHVINFFKYYNGDQTFAAEKTPNVFDFGAYHIGLAQLYYTFEYGESETPSICYGFNFSSNSAINFAKFANEPSYHIEDNSFELPTTFTKDDEEYAINRLASNAFDGTYLTVDNIGLPNEVKKITIPAQYQAIGTRAIAFAQPTSEITTLTFKRWTSPQPYQLLEDAFYQLPNLSVIDMSDFNADDCNKITETRWAQSLRNVHINWQGDTHEGDIYLPEGWDVNYKEQWRKIISSMGIKCYVLGEERNGWLLTTKPEH